MRTRSSWGMAIDEEWAVRNAWDAWANDESIGDHTPWGRALIFKAFCAGVAFQRTVVPEPLKTQVELWGVNPSRAYDLMNNANAGNAGIGAINNAATAVRSEPTLPVEPKPKPKGSILDRLIHAIANQ